MRTVSYTHLFIRPTAEELANYGEPDFVSFNASKAKVDNYKELGLNSETATVFNLKTNEQVILNTWYGGEMKKGMFLSLIHISNAVHRNILSVMSLRVVVYCLFIEKGKYEYKQIVCG